MSIQLSDEIINKQKEKVFTEIPSLSLVAPCKIGEGILKLDEDDRSAYIDEFNHTDKSICFFIPASGSGSRMFQFLYEFLEDPNETNRGQVEQFLNSISDFAFYRQLPFEIRNSLEKQNFNFEDIVSYLLYENGLSFGFLPKGMIPFHSHEPFILNPFQSHILQGLRVKSDKANFHFTIQSEFENDIRTGIGHVKGLTGHNFQVRYSEQAISSNSAAFLDSGEVLLNDEKEIITRPSGHGALLENLNNIKEDLIFIKNIDNIQHLSHSKKAIATWKMLGGIVLSLKNDILELVKDPTMEGLTALNDRYQLYSQSEIESCQTPEKIRRLIDRPTRVCGMVKNQGQPGGGPFWVAENGRITKQIVEKAQISSTGDQYHLMIQSTHFNPVMIVASAYSVSGEKFDLNEYCDCEKYFIVHKKYKGKNIRFLEQPGLWNGGMAFWNTVFVEIPSSTFTPVKTVLDLLNDSHRE